MSKGKGYLLPDDPYTEELRWFLVAVPDRDEYVRAALGAYTRFSKWYVWERTGDNSGALAADAWDEAIHETLRAWEMSLLDTLLANTDEVETLLRELIALQCCAGSGPTAEDFYPDGIQIAPNDDQVDTTGSDVVRDTGTPPGSFVDWASYDTAFCAEVTAFVDETLPFILNIAEEFFDVVQTVAFPVVIAAAAAIAAAMGIAVPAFFLSATQIASAIELIRGLLTDGDTVFDTYAAEIAAARQTLICSIYAEDTAEAAAAAFRTELAVASPKGYDWIRSTAPLDFLIRRLFNADTDADNSGGFGGPGGDCACDTPLVAGTNAIPIAYTVSSPSHGSNHNFTESGGDHTITGNVSGNYAGLRLLGWSGRTYTHLRDLTGWNIVQDYGTIWVGVSGNYNSLRLTTSAPSSLGGYPGGCNTWVQADRQSDPVVTDLCSNISGGERAPNEWVYVGIPSTEVADGTYIEYTFRAYRIVELAAA